MKYKIGMVPGTLITIASVCFVGGIILISGGDISNADLRNIHVNR